MPEYLASIAYPLGEKRSQKIGDPKCSIICDTSHDANGGVAKKLSFSKRKAPTFHQIILNL